MKTQLIQIDRSRPVDLNKLMGSGALDLSIESDDPQAVSLTQIDPAKVRLELVLDINEARPTRVNERLHENLARLKQQGLILLDAKAAEALLANPTAIPSSWIEIADSDSMNDLSGTIRFDGTILASRSTTQSRVLSPFFLRGAWTCGLADREQSPESLDLFQKSNGRVRLKEYTVVLVP